MPVTGIPVTRVEYFVSCHEVGSVNLNAGEIEDICEKGIRDCAVGQRCGSGDLGLVRKEVRFWQMCPRGIMVPTIEGSHAKVIQGQRCGIRIVPHCLLLEEHAERAAINRV